MADSAKVDNFFKLSFLKNKTEEKRRNQNLTIYAFPTMPLKKKKKKKKKKKCPKILVPFDNFGSGQKVVVFRARVDPRMFKDFVGV